MAMAQNFRSAFHGFNREDVVRYLEYLNSKHNSAINQLKSENQTLTDELKALRAQTVSNPAAEAECARLQEENQKLLQQCGDLAGQIAKLQAQMEEAQKNKPLAEEELEAYRRAEQAERAAKERARQIYCQATGALAEATTQVDEAAEDFKLLSQRIATQMTDLQSTIDRSKEALTGAAATLYGVCSADTDSQ
ncbi:MAG: hypothetical protein E7454_07840 [Ruminococcaceae bacterium]|nr:hypothetical protein [Oscillospiraceae bacterium]